MTLRKSQKSMREFVKEQASDRAVAKAGNDKLLVAPSIQAAQKLAEEAIGAVEDADLPVEDGLPPGAPANVVAGKDSATGLGSITYDPALRKSPDHVVSAEVRYRKVGDLTWVTQEASPVMGLVGINLTGLNIVAPADNFEAQAQFTDYFGVVSGWYPTVPVVSIPETYIPYLRADRLVAGTIAVLLDMVVGGAVVAGRTKLSAAGLEVGVLSDSIFYDWNNDIDLDSRVSSSNAIAGNRGTITWNNQPALERSMEIVQSTSEQDQIASVLMAAMKSGTDLTGSQNAYIYIMRSPMAEGSIGWIKLHGDVFMDREVMFERAPESSAAATLDTHLTRRSDVDARIALKATDLTLVSPSATSGWSEVAGNPIQVRRSGAGWVSMSGKVRNTSGSAKVAGANIFTNVIANRPSTPRTFFLPRTDNAQAWVVDAGIPVGVNANGDVVNRVNVGAGVEFDLSGIGYQVGV